MPVGPNGVSSRSRRERSKRLEEIAAKVRAHGGVSVEPMQLAALLLEKKTEELSDREAESSVRPKRHAKP